jgi:hypothetical protein
VRLAYVTRPWAGGDGESEPHTVPSGTCVGVIHEDEYCVAFAYGDDMQLLELYVYEDFLAYVK